MPNEKTFDGRARKTTISLAISALLILGILTGIGFIVNDGNITKAAPLASSSSAIVVGGNSSNNNIQKQKQQLPSKTHEYTLIAQDTTVEIAPGVRVDAW